MLWVQWIIVAFLILLILSGSTTHSWEFTHSVQGNVMSPITTCPDSAASDLRPENIHIVISLTTNMQDYYRNYIETVQYYSSMHGYHFRLVDPSAMLTKFGGDFKPFFSSMTAGKAVLSLKSLISLCKLYSYS